MVKPKGGWRRFPKCGAVHAQNYGPRLLILKMVQQSTPKKPKSKLGKENIIFGKGLLFLFCVQHLTNESL